MPRDYDVMDESFEEKPKRGPATFQDLVAYAAAKQEKKAKEELDFYRVLYLCLFVPAFFLEAYVFHHLWFWFIQPIFKIATPGLPQIMGLLLLLSTVKVSSEPTLEYLKKAVWKIFLNPLVLLVIGWLISRFL